MRESIGGSLAAMIVTSVENIFGKGIVYGKSETVSVFISLAAVGR